MICYVIAITDDWRVDGYRWYQNGTKLIPSSDPKFRKIYFSIVLPSGRDLKFKRLAYFLLNDKHKRVLIHYTGDSDVAVDFPHGNSKGDQKFFRTCPSVITKLASVHNLPSNVYKKCISTGSCLPEFQSNLMPRNYRQIITKSAKKCA